MPALLTSTSTGPILFMTFLTAAGSAMSQWMQSPLRSSPCTVRPSSRRKSTTARPMVPAAPVTTAVFPLRSVFKRGLLPQESPCAEGYQRDEQQIHREQRPLRGVRAGQPDHDTDQDAGQHRTPEAADAAQHDDDERR